MAGQKLIVAHFLDLPGLPIPIYTLVTVRYQKGPSQQITWVHGSCLYLLQPVQSSLQLGTRH